MTRVFVNCDAAGAFLSLTRPGCAAEEVRLSIADTVRLMKEAAEAWLRTRQKVSVTPSRWPKDDMPEPLIGHFRE